MQRWESLFQNLRGKRVKSLVKSGILEIELLKPVLWGACMQPCKLHKFALAYLKTKILIHRGPCAR